MRTPFNDIVVPHQTMNFVMEPKPIPRFDETSNLTEYFEKCRQNFDQLAIDALLTNALPSRTFMVQCLARDPERPLNLTYPAHLRGDWNHAAGAVLSLCHVYSTLKRNRCVSAHERARRYGDISLGNMVVFSSEAEMPYRDPLSFPCHLFAFGLKTESQRPALPEFVDVITSLRCPADAAASVWSVNLKDAITKIEREDNCWLEKSASPHVMTFNGVLPHIPAERKTFDWIGDDASEGDSVRTKKCFGLLQNISQDVEYLDSVSAMGSHGQIVLCMPQVVQWRQRPAHDRREATGDSDLGLFDSGLTVVLSGTDPPSETELLQIMIVARSMASYLASIYGSVRTYSQNIRSQIASDAMEMLKHSAGNCLDSIAARANNVASDAKLLKRVIGGAVGFAQRERTYVRENGTILTWGRLGSHGRPLDQDIVDCIFPLHEKFRFEKSNLDDVAVDARFVPLIEELARNLSKGDETSEGVISVAVDPGSSGMATIEVLGQGSQSDFTRILNRLESIRVAVNLPVSLRGVAAIALLVNALRTETTEVHYILGSFGMALYEKDSPPTATMPLESGLLVKIWAGQSPVGGKRSQQPFRFRFININVLGE